MLEFLVTFPLVLLCIFAALQFALISGANLIVQYAAYCAARAGLVYQGDQDLWQFTVDSKDVQALSFQGLNDIYAGHEPHNEAQLAGCEAAAHVCSLLTMMASGGVEGGGDPLEIPGWGAIPSHGVSRVKTRAWMSNHRPTTFPWPPTADDIQMGANELDQWSTWPSARNEWNVYAVVEHDFELIMPLIGPLLAWGEGFSFSGPRNVEGLWSEAGIQARGAAGYMRGGGAVPHIRLVQTCVLPKPYKTVVPTGIYGGIPGGFGWGEEFGYLYWMGDNPGSPDAVLLMDDTTGVHAHFHNVDHWSRVLDFQGGNPLLAGTMTISIDVAGIHFLGNSLEMCGEELFNFDAVRGQTVQDIDSMHHFEITVGRETIRRLFSNPVNEWEVRVNTTGSGGGLDDIVWRNLQIRFNEKDEQDLQITH